MLMLILGMLVISHQSLEQDCLLTDTTMKLKDEATRLEDKYDLAIAVEDLIWAANWRIFVPH